MRLGPIRITVLAAAALAAAASSPPAAGPAGGDDAARFIPLPEPRLEGPMSLETALYQRRSRRRFAPDPLTLAELGQLLWAAQGVTEPRAGKRTAPSAMGFHPLQVYVLAERVAGLNPGRYRYRPRWHDLEWIAGGHPLPDLAGVTRQGMLRRAPALLAIVGETWKTPEASWIDLEAGHAAQNVYLQAASLKLATVVLAGFNPDRVRRALGLKEKVRPVYLMPVGRPGGRP